MKASAILRRFWGCVLLFVERYSLVGTTSADRASTYRHRLE
jgi:hypothetical protein